jgi:Alpha/beta hydrolase family
VLPALRQVPFTNADGSEGVDVHLDQEAFPGHLLLPTSTRDRTRHCGHPAPGERCGFSAPSGPPAWKSIPSWYLLGTEDRAIPPATQRFEAERATATIEEVPASHASMFRSRTLRRS